MKKWHVLPVLCSLCSDSRGSSTEEVPNALGVAFVSQYFWLFAGSGRGDSGGAAAFVAGAVAAATVVLILPCCCVKVFTYGVSL